MQLPKVFVESSTRMAAERRAAMLDKVNPAGMIPVVAGEFDPEHSHSCEAGSFVTDGSQILACGADAARQLEISRTPSRSARGLTGSAARVEAAVPRRLFRRDQSGAGRLAVANAHFDRPQWPRSSASTQDTGCCLPCTAILTCAIGSDGPCCGSRRRRAVDVPHWQGGSDP